MGTKDVVERRARASRAGVAVCTPSCETGQDGPRAVYPEGDREEMQGDERGPGGTDRMEPQATLGAVRRETSGKCSARE